VQACLRFGPDQLVGQQLIDSNATGSRFGEWYRLRGSGAGAPIGRGGVGAQAARSRLFAGPAGRGAIGVGHLANELSEMVQALAASEAGTCRWLLAPPT